MKTREKQRVSPKVQRVPPTALSSTEHSRIRRKAIYDNKKLHMEVKEKDRERKKLKAIEKTMRREEDPEGAERYREKERERKRKQRLVKKKPKEAASEKLTSPVKRKIKKLENKLRRKCKEKESAVKDTRRGLLRLHPHLRNLSLARPSGVICHQSQDTRLQGL